MNKAQIVLHEKIEKPTIVNLPVGAYVGFWAAHDVKTRRRGHDIVFQLKPMVPEWGKGDRTISPPLREVTEAFLGVQDPSQAAQFLARYGGLGRLDDLYAVKEIKSVSWRAFMQMQSTIRQCWTTPAPDWQVGSADINFEFHVDLLLPKPNLFTVCQSVVQVLMADLILSNISGLRYGFCARPDCGNLFQRTSAHERKFCSSECAHLESVRRFRAKSSKQRSSKRKK